MSKKVLGCDLGTSTSCVSVIEGGKAIVVVNSEGSRTTPSVVSLKDGDRKVGAAANRQRVVSPQETIFNIKRFMGSTYDQCSEVISRVPYKVVNRDGKPRIVVNGQEYSPEEISSYILTKMKQTAEDYVGEKITDAVITVPAWFDNDAREATKLAGELCGLNVLRIINEPTSAILASNIDTKTSDKNVLVADIGGGTTDFSVCSLSDGITEVLASKGDVFLGGADFDNAITQWVIETFKNDEGIDLSNDTQALSRIIEAAEKAKIELSSTTSTEINLPYITMKDNTAVHLKKVLTRAKLEQLTSNLVERIVECGKESLKAANLDKSKLDCVLLVGGQTRSLAIQEALIKEFGDILNKSVNPDEAVALGAATMANIIVGGEGSKEVLLLDVTPLDLGIETMGGVMTKVVEANTTIPCKREQTFTTAQDNQPSVTLHVLQGSRPLAKDNKSLGLFNLDGIMPSRRGVPQIVVSFDIDANGILTVSAKDKATGKEQHITIESKGNLTQEEIDRIKREAEEHAAEDEKTKADLEKINKCDSTIYQTESSLENLKDNPALTEDDKKYFNEKIEELKSLKESKSFEEMEKLITEVNTRWYGVTAKAYGNNNGNGNTSSNPFAGGPFDFSNFNPQGGGNDTPKNDNPTPDDVEEV